VFSQTDTCFLHAKPSRFLGVVIGAGFPAAVFCTVPQCPWPGSLAAGMMLVLRGYALWYARQVSLAALPVRVTEPAF